MFAVWEANKQRAIAFIEANLNNIVSAAPDDRLNNDPAGYKSMNDHFL
jgi:hypothetical protein